MAKPPENTDIESQEYWYSGDHQVDERLILQRRRSPVKQGARRSRPALFRRGRR